MLSLVNYLKTNFKTIFAYGILLLMACGPSYDPTEYWHFFNVNTSNVPYKSDMNFVYKPSEVYFRDAVAEATDSSALVKEWATYFKSVPTTELAKFMYHKATKAPVGVARDPLAAQYWAIVKSEYETETFYWQNLDFNADSLTKAQNVTLALEGFQASKGNIFMKKRFENLVIKSFFLNENYSELLQFYEKNKSIDKTNSTLLAHTLGYVAGAYVRTGQKHKAMVLYGNLFEKYPFMRTKCVNSLRVARLSVSDSTLLACESNLDKINVLALTSLANDYYDGKIIQQLFDLSPNYSLGELIVSRHLNSLEHNYLLKEDPIDILGDKNYLDSLKTDAQDELNLLKNTLAKQVQNPEVTNKAFWNTVNAYIYYLLEDYTKANEILQLAMAEKGISNELKHQQKLQQALLIATNSKNISPEIEAKILPIIFELNNTKEQTSGNALIKVCDLMSSLYAKKEVKSLGWWQKCTKQESSQKVENALAKGLFLKILASFSSESNVLGINYLDRKHSFNDVVNNVSVAELKELLAFKNVVKTDSTWFKAAKVLDQIDLYMPLAQKQLENGDYSDAKVSFAKSKALGTTKSTIYVLQVNPFFIGFEKGSIYKPNVKTDAVAFLEEMITLSGKSDAESLYKLACGQYNLSYWGNCWHLIRDFKSVYDISPINKLSSKQVNNLSVEYFTQKKVKSIFEKALAKATNRELKAKILYGLALIEANEFYLYMASKDPNFSYGSEDWDEYNQKLETFAKSVPDIRKKYLVNLKQIYEQYSDTEFAQLVLEECSTYGYFVASVKE
jgi:hypothetical protein